ncbi:hypothetical protein [Gilliamella sp. B3367]|uniref:hypothetical protein n=1 Tax=Gilliamella sp. B3367 TaxID=2817989 RepID=UPI0022697F08|nr:hypothetical protein [Gilliamella sp. B3367]MCX8593901.1 hypothetical protein [Gilliamella sp. B3367]
MALFLPFSGHALTSQTTRNAIQGSAPYLTFDGGRTRVVDANGLLGITLSDGTQYTPLNNPSSSSTPIVLPDEGQSFADIGMLVPTNANSVVLSTLIDPPYNYWGDDDGDGDISATGSLSLSIVDKNGRAVSRNAVPEICKAPYQVKLSSTDVTLATRYGVPSSSSFSASNATYYIYPNASPMICFARPNLMYGKLGDNEEYLSDDYAGPVSIWDPDNGFLPQSTSSSSYGLNFPTTGARGLYFDLVIGGGASLSWSPVSLGGITATMTNSPINSGAVRVTLTGPFATESQINSSNPGLIPKPSLPQTFELVGRDSRGNAVVKYGFTLRKWFVLRGSREDSHYDNLSWCNSLGYRMPRVKDLTNAVRTDAVIPSATPSSPDNHYQRRIGAGFITEWGNLYDYPEFGIGTVRYMWFWTDDKVGPSPVVVIEDGAVVWGGSFNVASHELCVYP